MGKRLKKQYPENFRTMLGFSLSNLSVAFSTTVISIFMLFLTDYSGIDSLMGRAGFAAGFATLFLLLTRIVDAIDDPLQAWVMDRSKETKFGKYRRFGFVGLILMTVGIIMLFAIPTAVKSSVGLLWVWCIVGYIVMEMGSAMAVSYPILQKATTDARVRTKIATVIRFAQVIGALPGILFVSIVAAVNGENGNLGESATTVAVFIALLFFVLSNLGFLLLKERYVPDANKENGEESKLDFKAILNMFKINKPLWVHQISYFIGDMNYKIISAVAAYFIKWYFCADLGTGDVNLVSFAAMSGIYSILLLLPNLISPFVCPLFIKLSKSVDKALRNCMAWMAICYVLMFVFAVTGVMRAVPALFFLLFFLEMIPAGMGAVFAPLINIDCADYVEYTTGTNMTAMINSVHSVFDKARAALGGVIPGVLLVMFGYSVDSATGAFVGDLANLPSMVTGLSIVTFAIPCVLTFVSAIMYTKLYKVTPELRATVNEELTKRRAAAQNETK